jgi:serine/threonine protein phosphatase PrpC
MSVNLTVVGRSETGLVRAINEDALVIADLTGDRLVSEQRMAKFEVGRRGVLLAVSDGMGGHKAGEVASALVVESLRRSMEQTPSGVAPDALLDRAAAQANRDVWHAAHLPGREHMGATLTALFIHDRAAYIAEVGDSRAYLVRGGAIKQVTHDQSYVQLMIDSGVMSAEEARRSELSSVILQAMGLKATVQIALGRLGLRQRDAFVLCSDGLSSLVTNDEIRQTVLNAGRLDAVCDQLVDLALRRGGTDNITVVVAGVSGDLALPVASESLSDAVQVMREFEPRRPSAG